MKPISVERARAVDRDATERLQMPSILLMENAARAVAEQALAMGDRFLILCGPGNNGGDGMAAARHLGRRALVFLMREPDAVRCPDAALQLQILRNAAALVHVGSPPKIGEGERWVWIDALFGTGLTRALTDEAAEWVGAFNGGLGPKLCVDVPSGLHGDSGEVLGDACRADVTVTFQAPKTGLVMPDARDHVGKLVVAPLGLPEPA